MSTYQPPLKLLVGDCREVLATLPDESVQCCVTSPPYWGLRDYGHAGQIGQEATPEAFVTAMVEVFREVRRVLKTDGTCWVNLGDSYNSGPSGGLGGSTLMGGQKNQAQSNRAWRNGSGRADGKVDGRAQRNRNGVHAAGLKHKDLVGIPWRVAFALQADGWYLRQDIIWSKPNPMPESVRDRCTKAHEYIFLLTKSAKYFYDHDAIKEQAVCGTPPGNHTHSAANEYEAGDKHHRTKVGLVAFAQKKRESAKKGSFNGKTEAMADTGQNAFRAVTDTRNKRSVWTVPTKPYAEAHFATYPPELIRPCILAGTRPGDTVLDPFGGSGTTGQVALEHGRQAILIELNPKYAEIAERRTQVNLGLGI